MLYVWCKAINSLPTSPRISQRFEKTLRPHVEKAALETLLKPSTQLFCEECGFTVENIGATDRVKFNRHMKRHMVEKFSCDCKIEFSSIAVKEAHYDLVHSGKNYVACKFCTFVNTPLVVANHVKSKHDLQNHFCDVCGNKFYTKVDLNAHFSSAHKILSCPECPGLTFVGSYNLKKHKRKEHAKSKPPRASCNQCDKTFASGCKLKYHVLTVHTKNEDKPFQCVLCGLGYPNRDKMGRHMKMHVRKNECGEDYLLQKQDNRLNKKKMKQEEALKGEGTLKEEEIFGGEG